MQSRWKTVKEPIKFFKPSSHPEIRSHYNGSSQRERSWALTSPIIAQWRQPTAQHLQVSTKETNATPRPIRLQDFI